MFKKSLLTAFVLFSSVSVANTSANGVAKITELEFKNFPKYQDVNIALAADTMWVYGENSFFNDLTSNPLAVYGGYFLSDSGQQNTLDVGSNTIFHNATFRDVKIEGMKACYNCTFRGNIEFLSSFTEIHDSEFDDTSIVVSSTNKIKVYNSNFDDVSFENSNYGFGGVYGSTARYSYLRVNSNLENNNFYKTDVLMEPNGDYRVINNTFDREFNNRSHVFKIALQRTSLNGHITSNNFFDMRNQYVMKLDVTDNSNITFSNNHALGKYLDDLYIDRPENLGRLIFVDNTNLRIQ